jgi:hypothetical protein
MAEDFNLGAIWAARGKSYIFLELFRKARSEREETEKKRFDKLCYALGWGLFWFIYDTGEWKYKPELDRVFADLCLDHYCANVILQQQSIFAFLLCWNHRGGGKDVGVLIAKMVWESRAENLIGQLD